MALKKCHCSSSERRSSLPIDGQPFCFFSLSLNKVGEDQFSRWPHAKRWDRAGCKAIWCHGRSFVEWAIYGQAPPPLDTVNQSSTRHSTLGTTWEVSACQIFIFLPHKNIFSPLKLLLVLRLNWWALWGEGQRHWETHSPRLWGLGTWTGIGLDRPIKSVLSPEIWWPYQLSNWGWDHKCNSLIPLSAHPPCRRRPKPPLIAIEVVTNYIFISS